MGRVLLAWRVRIMTSSSPQGLGALSQALAKAVYTYCFFETSLSWWWQKLHRWGKSLRARTLPLHTTLMLLIEPLSCSIVIILFQILKQGFGCDLILKLRNLVSGSWKACHFGVVSGLQSSVRWRCQFAVRTDCCSVFEKSPDVPSRCKPPKCKPRAIHGT